MEEAKDWLVPKNYGLWDYESASIPLGCNVDKVLSGIIYLLHSHHLSGSFTLEAVVGKFEENRIPATRRRELEERGIHVTSMNSAEKQVADTEIKRRMKEWMGRCQNGCLFLLTSDKDYASLMKSMQNLPNICKTILIYIPSSLKGNVNLYPRRYRYSWSRILSNIRIVNNEHQRIAGFPVVKDISSNIVWAVNKVEEVYERVDNSSASFTLEENRLWNIVRFYSFDFNAWSALIDLTERIAQDNIAKIQKVYDEFLAEFPLCYGYWKKYADHEARIGAMHKVEEVYDRAVKAVAYSVEIWLHYCSFAINTYRDPDKIRRLFDQALDYVGTDFFSFPLWDKYIEYEYMQQDWSQLARIYTEILKYPIQYLDRYFSSFKDLIQSRLLPETSSDEGTYLSIRQTMYQKAKEFESKIIGFEMAIRRPYFHVHPLNVAELENWHNYLDFIEIDGDLIKVVKLFERCVVACANYSEFWIRYVIKMKKSGMPELAESALARATQIFVKKQPAIHLFAARFKEENNDIAGARAAYQLVHSDIAPGLLEAVVKHANMERRQDNLEKACSLYEQMIAVEKLREHSAILPQLYAQYLRFLYLVSGDPEKARKIIVEALDHVPPSKPFLEELIQFETIQRATRQIDYLEPLVEKVINPDADNQNISSSTEREELSLIYIEFLSVFGDVESWIKAEDKHAKLFLPHRSS